VVNEVLTADMSQMRSFLVIRQFSLRLRLLNRTAGRGWNQLPRGPLPRNAPLGDRSRWDLAGLPRCPLFENKPSAALLFAGAVEAFPAICHLIL
jgi:hypothetical protein